mmetsp:Transcript_19773/g.62251  ORF Transcript_19773/g.62251 Transcript_19773/m.62251 type:complete len:282 (-) Transcript_19773:33-878(-)
MTGGGPSRGGVQAKHRPRCHALAPEPGSPRWQAARAAAEAEQARVLAWSTAGPRSTPMGAQGKQQRQKGSSVDEEVEEGERRAGGASREKGELGEERGWRSELGFGPGALFRPVARGVGRQAPWRGVVPLSHERVGSGVRIGQVGDGIAVARPCAGDRAQRWLGRLRRVRVSEDLRHEVGFREGDRDVAAASGDAPRRDAPRSLRPRPATRPQSRLASPRTHAPRAPPARRAVAPRASADSPAPSRPPRPAALPATPSARLAPPSSAPARPLPPVACSPSS